MFHTNTSGATGDKAKCDDACFRAWWQFHQLTSLLGGVYAATSVGIIGEEEALSSTAKAAEAPSVLVRAEVATEAAPLVKVYDPFYRLDDHAEAIGQTGWLLGTPARNIYMANTASVKAYVGELPPGRSGIQFYTETKPDSVGADTRGSTAWWYGPQGSDVTLIRITPIKVVP